MISVKLETSNKEKMRLFQIYAPDSSYNFYQNKPVNNNTYERLEDGRRQRDSSLVGRRTTKSSSNRIKSLSKIVLKNQSENQFIFTREKRLWNRGL